MPTLEQKKAQVEEITELLKQSGAVYVTDYKGMSVKQINALRSQFRKSGIHFKVYKNTLLKYAMDTIGGYEELYSYLEEQNAFAFVHEEYAAPAKVIKEALRTSDKPAFKAAFIDGAVYHSNQLDALAVLKTKNEVIGEVIGLLLSPISNVVGALQAQGQTLAGCINVIAERGES
ncbi:MAG: 50S ribosomal protein L10 [Pseudomonadales bacterium]